MLGIVIPYYKITFFEETLQSLANQTDKRFKVYIGDDTSPDNPKMLLDTYKGVFDFEYIRFNENFGGRQLVKQWERCMALVKDEKWLMVLGDDDILSYNCVEAFYKVLPEINNNNIKVVRYATEIINDKSQVVSQIYKHPKLEQATDFFYRRFTNKTRSSLSEYIFKRKAYKKHGFHHYNLGWFTDDRAWLEFSEFKTIYTINDAVVSFRLSDENISRQHFKTVEKAIVKLDFFKFIIFKHLSKFKKEQQRHFLVHYEQLVYAQKKVDFCFWLLVFLLFIRRFTFVQSIKFTRRVFIHLKKNAY